MQERRFAPGDGGHGVEIVEQADAKGPLIGGDEILKCGGFKDGARGFEVPFPHLGRAVKQLRQT